MKKDHHISIKWLFCFHLYISPFNVYLNSKIPAVRENSVPQNSRQLRFLEDLYQQIDIIYVPSLTQSQKTADMSHYLPV